MVTVAVLIPTKGRPTQALDRIIHLLSQKTPAGVRLLVVAAVPENDAATIDTLGLILVDGNGFKIVSREAGSTAVDGWNTAYEAVRDRARWFVLGADDIAWRAGWLEEALRVAEETGAQVVGLNDGYHTNLEDYAPHYMAHRQFIAEELGGRFIPEGYQAWWFDREICERAARRGLYAPAWRAVAEHRHPDWGTAVDDETYLEARPGREADRALYLARRAAGYVEADYESESA